MVRKVFVGKVPYQLSAEGFDTHWKQYAGFESCYLVFNREKPGENKGFGFVIFDNDENAQVAVAGENVINGVKVDAKIHEPRPEKYFVAGLPKTLDEATVKAYFEKLGKLTKFVFKAKDTSDTNFAFINVILHDDGMDVFKMDHAELGPKVTVKKSDGRGQQAGRGGFGGGRGGYGQWGAWGGQQMGGWGQPYGGYGQMQGGWGAQQQYGGYGQPEPQLAKEKSKIEVFAQMVRIIHQQKQGNVQMSNVLNLLKSCTNTTYTEEEAVALAQVVDKEFENITFLMSEKMFIYSSKHD